MRATRGGHSLLTASCCLLAALSLLLVVLPISAVLADRTRHISKRQVANGAQSSSMATSSVQMGGGGGGPAASAKPAAGGPPMEPPGVGAHQEPDEEARRPAPKRSRRPRPQVARRPPPRRGRYEEDDQEEEYHSEDGDCYDDDYETGDGVNLFQSMAARPMRQMTRMMGHMFDQMQGMSSDMMFNGRAGRGNVVSAAASSSSYGGGGGDEDGDGNDDGYSRTASIVNNNGRTRGIVSETRNGRTKTQRIGDD